jgi:hypothetical protein
MMIAVHGWRGPRRCQEGLTSPYRLHVHTDQFWAGCASSANSHVPGDAPGTSCIVHSNESAAAGATELVNWSMLCCATSWWNSSCSPLPLLDGKGGVRWHSKALGLHLLHAKSMARARARAETRRDTTVVTRASHDAAGPGSACCVPRTLSCCWTHQHTA